MKKIWMLTDYKNHFGSKWDASPYRSGMDINLILEKFKERKYSLEVINFSDAANDSKIRTSDFVIYTSSEDSGYEYKSFIEDVVLYLENCGARTIPSFNHLRANNNKVYMELLRKFQIFEVNNSLNSRVFGAKEEFEDLNIDKPLVFKSSEGAMSSGVFLGSNNLEKNKSLDKVSRNVNYVEELKDFLEE